MTQGDWIKKARLDAGYTLEEVAVAAKTTKQTIYKYETNVVTNIPMDKVVLIASFLKVTPQRLLGWDIEPHTPTITDEDIKLALWNGEHGMTDEQLEEIKTFANYIKSRTK